MQHRPGRSGEVEADPRDGPPVLVARGAVARGRELRDARALVRGALAERQAQGLHVLTLGLEARPHGVAQGLGGGLLQRRLEVLGAAAGFEEDLEAQGAASGHLADQVRFRRGLDGRPRAEAHRLHGRAARPLGEEVLQLPGQRAGLQHEHRGVPLALLDDAAVHCVGSLGGVVAALLQAVPQGVGGLASRPAAPLAMQLLTADAHGLHRLLRHGAALHQLLALVRRALLGREDARAGGQREGDLCARRRARLQVQVR
mmetsp:Transcript_57942/g.149091  ORF Transcript_57942/g.149091 Transcript_57942/m.149091 type:complete len:258 (-) Transcript_57942:298-1071(-)